MSQGCWLTISLAKANQIRDSHSNTFERGKLKSIFLL